MELSITVTSNFEDNYLHMIENSRPHDCSKSVSMDVMNMLSNLPLERRHQNDALLDQNINDFMIKSYLINVLEEIAEIRNSIKSLSPFLRNSQQIVQNRVFAYARNHTPYSKRVRSLRSDKSTNDSGKNEDNMSNKSFFWRVWHMIVNAIAPFVRTRTMELNDKKKVKEAFQEFYFYNGISFKYRMALIMGRCKRIEMLLNNFKRKIKQYDIRTAEENDNVGGIAYEMRVHRGQLSNWRRDFDYAWKQAKSVRRLFGLVPIHNCWEAIFNIMTSQVQLNRYI